MSIKYNDKTNNKEILLAGISPVDQILNGTSKNAISNKAVYNALAEKIEVTVENLTNFYNKSQTYNKTEVRALVDAISTLTIEVVNSLPTQDISTTTIYFLKQSGTNVYDQYVYVNNAWVKIGDTQIDLSGYMTTAAFNIAIADYYDKSAIDTMIANYYTKTQVDNLLQNVEIDVDNELSSISENPVQNKVIKNALDDKQDLIFEGTTAQWNAVSDKSKYSLVVITDDADYVGNIVDSVTDGNMSAVTSNAVYDALANKQDKLTNPLTKADVVNNLTTTTTNVPLSAAQGKAVNDKLTNFMSSGTNYVGVRNTNNAVTGGVGPDGNAFVLGGDPSDTKHCNLYYDGSNLYLDGKFNSVSKIMKISDAVVDYSKTLSSKVEHTAGMYRRSNKVYYFGFVLHAKSAISANETLVTLPVATNWWGKLSAITSTLGSTSVVVNNNIIYTENAIPSGDYIEIHGCAPII